MWQGSVGDLAWVWNYYNTKIMKESVLPNHAQCLSLIDLLLVYFWLFPHPRSLVLPCFYQIIWWGKHKVSEICNRYWVYLCKLWLRQWQLQQSFFTYQIIVWIHTTTKSRIQDSHWNLILSNISLRNSMRRYVWNIILVLKIWFASMVHLIMY